MRSEQYNIGDVVRGKVTGIQAYGAFVALDRVTQGLVHISEITNGYVKDIREFLEVGNEVEVKILSIDSVSGKISLSIRAAAEPSIHLHKATKRQTTLQIPKPTSGGFRTLQHKLDEWIAESSRKYNIIK
ncbi:S1 domain-containing post-transcriptional regulator GSP13 [Priestia taiwanensis]|uniref:General stress protein 13 n=1 Tax=Priestia taiwanensis TaxID=1347902 RepID=A0A917AVM7_9BACI|nr:S1 domain-containing post-transcriptional regulator GSP13 [Priestia taiwanensis]MBM7364611.1 general stress protein 13 [Priestia taiwanensis]GGE80150.1 general stress protein 13 [Priestia taiwanensis]